MGSETRQRNHHINVRVNAEELALIKDIARQCSMKPSGLLRALGTNYQPKSTVDHQAILELLRLRGDLGRVGGLLKMWLSSPEKEDAAKTFEIEGVVQRLTLLQSEIRKQVLNL